jgi:hypothetical protein
MKKIYFLFLAVLLLLPVKTVFAGQSGLFSKLAMRAYNSGYTSVIKKNGIYFSAYSVSIGSGCKLVPVIKGFNTTITYKDGYAIDFYSKPAAVENYKICSGKIVNVKKTDMAKWVIWLYGSPQFKSFVDKIANKVGVSVMTASMTIGKFIISETSHHKIHRSGDSPFFVTVYIFKNNKLISVNNMQTF